MKKLIALFFSLILLFTGCSQNKEIKIYSRTHNNVFTYSVNYILRYDDAFFKTIDIKLDRNVFFEQLASNDKFAGKYNNDIVLLYKENDNNSSYFAIVFVGEYYNNFRYDFKSAEVFYVYSNNYLMIDFPFFVLENDTYLGEGEFDVNCTFDYLIDFYSRLSQVLYEQGDDYIIINAFFDKEMVEEKVKIQNSGDNKIYVTMV